MKRFLWLTVLILLLLASLPLLAEGIGQDSSQDSNIAFSGQIVSIDGSLIVVNGLNVQTDQAEISGLLEVGATVHVEGSLQPDGQILAQTITRTDDGPVTLIITGEITFVGGGSIVVNGTNILLGDFQPAFAIEVGQFVRVTGSPQPDGSIIALDMELLPAPEETPEATPEPQPDDNNVIIVISGPVDTINVNIITIYGIPIEVNPDDPALTVLHIGDRIRIEGRHSHGNDTTIVFVAVNIVFIDVDVFVNNNSGQVWRDSGDCGNGPPPWAPAHGWRRRCQSGNDQGDEDED